MHADDFTTRIPYTAADKVLLRRSLRKVGKAGGAWGDNGGSVIITIRGIHKSTNHHSKSGRCPCSFFGHAGIAELKRYPGGLVLAHTRRIREEMIHIPASQKSSTPRFALSSPSLRKQHMTHSLTSPNIVQAILSASSFEQ